MSRETAKLMMMNEEERAIYLAQKNKQPIEIKILKGDLKGEKGNKGDKGDNGEKGDKGDKGDKGNPGKDGIDGKDGRTIKGDKGEQGKTGDKGDKGDKGDDGENPDILEVVKELKKKQYLEPKDIKGMPINMNDMRWHGGGLSKVSTDGTTITGDGTPSNPLIATAVSENYKIKVTSADTTPDYLVSKIIAGTGISITKENAGGNEDLKIANTAPDQTVAISAGTNITSVTGTYPNFTINAANQTTDISGKLNIDQTSPQTTVGTFTFPQIVDSGLTGSAGVVFSTAGRQLTSTGIGTSSQFIKGDSSLDSTSYQSAITTGTTSQYFRGDLSLATFPSIPAAQIQSDWNQTNNALLDYIKNKPTIPSVGTWGALNYPTWASGTPFVKMTAAGTFALDSSTYLTSISSSNVTTALGYTPVTNARTLTINGTAYDLTANRSWTIASGPSLGTTTQIPYMNVAGTDFLYGSGLTFNGTVLSSSGGVITNKIYPSADSTTALQFYKSNGTTNVLTLDTTNSRLGIGVTPTVALDVVGTGHFSGETTTYYGVKINTGQALTCRTTNDNSYGHVMKYSDANSEYFTIGTVNDSTAIILANGWQFLNPASSGRPSGSAIGLFQQNRKVSIRNYNDGVSTQIMTALLTIGAGAATAGNAPLKFITGPTLSIPELGAVEFNDPNIYFTPTGVLGPETFSSFLRTNWTLNTGWDATNAGDTKINKNAAGTATAILTTPLPTIGRAYTITITCDTYSGGGRVYVSYGGVSIPLGFGYFYQTDTLTATITATSTAGLTFTPDTSATRASFSAISIKLAAIEKKPFVLTDGANLTSGKVPVASTNGRLVDSAGVSGSFTTVDSKTVTVTNGLITSIV